MCVSDHFVSICVLFINRGPYAGFDPANPSAGRWYKFNDTVVEEFEMNKATLETECFGGHYKSRTHDTGLCQCPAIGCL